LWKKYQFQENIKTATTDAGFETLVDGKKCCKHCGSNLEEKTNSVNDSLLSATSTKLNNINSSVIKDKGSELSNELKTLTDQNGIKGLLGSPLGLILCSTIVLFGFLFKDSISGVPSCSNGEVKETVIDIATRNAISTYGSKNAQIFSFSVSMIRTVNTNEHTGAHSCASQLEFTASNTGKSGQIPITYTVENIEDEGQFYVNVSGLKAF